MKLLSQRKSVFTDYYRRDILANSYSVANLFNVMVWLIVIIIPFIIAFNHGCKFLETFVELICLF